MCEAKRQVGSTYRHLPLSNPGGRTKSNDERSRERTTPQTSLLPAPANNRLKSHPWPPSDVAGSDTLRAVYLVPRYTHQIDIHLVDVDGYFADRLSRVRVKEHALVRLDDLADLIQRLNDAGLIVHRHDRYEGCGRLYGGFEHFQVDDPILLYGQVGDLEALLGQLPTRIENAFVLGLDGDDVVLPLLVEVGDAFYGHVVGFGRP